MAIKITGTTVINDSQQFENITDINFIINKPTINSPADGSTTDSGLTPEIIGSVYNPLFDTDTRDYREFQVDLATGDFSSPERSNQLDSDSWVIDPSLDPDTNYKVRIRDVSINGTVSEWSDEISFTSANIFVDEPTVSVEDGPSDVPENPVISTSAFSVTGDTDTHQSTDWEVIRTSDSVTVFESLNDTSNLTSITVTTDLDESTEYEFRARHRGATFGTSSYGSVTATTAASFFAELGDSFCGGFYMGAITAAGTCYALVVAPNATGCADCQWKTSDTSTSGTCSDTDGYANTYPALENSTHPAGNWTATRTIGGFSDWYLPAIDELEVFYNNGGGNGPGDPLPSGEDFTIDEFYLSSTEFSTFSACLLRFTDNCRAGLSKDRPRKIRAVRRVPI